MNYEDRKALKFVYGLNYKDCNKVFALMRNQGISIDVAAKRVIGDKINRG